MKRMLGVALLVLAATVGVAQDKPAAEPALELMALYKQSGRSWSYKIINSIQGEAPLVKLSTTRITAVEGTIARCTTETSLADGTVLSSSSSDVDTSVVPEHAKAWAVDDLPIVKLDMGFATFECKKHQHKADGIQVTTWLSTEFHPLVVKRVTFESASTSVHKLTSFSAAQVDPWLLYKKEGRRWKTKSTINAGGRPTNSFVEYTVKEVREDAATYSMGMLDANGKAMFTQDQEMKFTKPGVAAPAGKAPQTTMETKKVEAGEFQCNLMDLGGTKSWTSVQWPMLVVAMESNTFTMELIEFDIGHDEHLFYRTKGNHYTVRRVTTTDAGVSEATVMWEVIDVAEDAATVRTTLTEGGKQMVTEDRHEFSTGDTEAVLFGEEEWEAEEWIEVEAGGFAALRTKASGLEVSALTYWTWNGLYVKEIRTDATSRVETEMIALNLQ
jgi:hypothetical protein